MLATAEWRSMNNARIMLMRNDGKTRMWIAKAPGVFGGVPDFVWARELPDDECKVVLENPWRMFDKPEPDGRVMFGG